MNCFANRLSALLFTTTLAVTAAAQEEIPVPGVLDTLVKPTANSLMVQLEAPKSALLVLGASLSPKTHGLRGDLPPILVQFEVLEFRLASGATKFELPRWIATYYAQFGMLDLGTGEMKASRVMMVEPAALPAEAAQQSEPGDQTSNTVQADPGDTGVKADYGDQSKGDAKS